jgi:hypothetical protein
MAVHNFLMLLTEAGKLYWWEGVESSLAPGLASERRLEDACVTNVVLHLFSDTSEV